MHPFLKKRITASFLIFLVLLVAGVFTLHFYKPEPKLPEATPVEVIKDTEPKYQVIGMSVEGRKIESFTYGNGKTHLLFVGGIHGGYEWNSVLLSYQFIDYLQENPAAIPKNLAVTIIPSLNPDGVYKVTKKEGRFAIADVSTSKEILEEGRFNARGVDLNRNFGCKWKPESTWREKTVSAGTQPFSEPEALAFKNFVEANNPNAVIFWHSQANAVYASECEAGVLPSTLDIMNAYSKVSEYQAVKSFTAYEISGDAEGWLASINIPAITVELQTHESIEWDRNLAGIKALFEYYRKEEISQQ